MLNSDANATEERPLAVSSELTWLERAGLALVGSVATQFVFLFAFWLGLPAHDGAKDAGPFEMFTDPMVLGVAAPVTLFGAALAHSLSHLWSSLDEPLRAWGHTCAATLLATAVGAFTWGNWGIPIAFAALLVSAMACRFTLPPRPSQADAQPAP